MKSKLRIVETQDQGRHCLASRDIPNKQTIITGEPYAFSFTRMASRRTCAWTLDSFEGPLQIGCPHCREVWYEEENFRHQAFGWHHLECRAFQQIQETRYNTSFKMLLKTMTRVFIRKAWENGLNFRKSGVPVQPEEKKWLRYETRIPWISDTVKWEKFEQLVSNRESYGKRAFAARIKMAEVILNGLPTSVIRHAFPNQESRESRLEYIAECICRYECNCFGYFNPDTGEQIGAAVIPDISYINHSCAPNAKTTYYVNGGPISVEATRDIRKGEEVNISYCDEGQSRKARQEYLKEYYHFTCACPKCRGKGGK